LSEQVGNFLGDLIFRVSDLFQLAACGLIFVFFFFYLFCVTRGFVVEVGDVFAGVVGKAFVAKSIVEITSNTETATLELKSLATEGTGRCIVGMNMCVNYIR